MAETTSHADMRTGAIEPLLPVLVGATLYVIVLFLGNNLLNDPDSYWHVVVGQWILTNGFPHADTFSFTFAGKPWIAKEWLSQVLFYEAHRAGGWPAMVVLSAVSIAVSFVFLSYFLQRQLAPIGVVAFAAIAFMLVAPHAVARPHVLALPVMVAWVGGLVRAADRRRAPPYALLLLMVLWANLHGGFTFGIFLVGAIGLDAIVSAGRQERRRVALVWVRFGVLAVVAGCITPYGPESMLVTWRILSLGPALGIIGEWKPADFSHLAGLEMALLVGAGFALYRGFTMPPVRIVILLGLLHMALSAERNGEMLGLLAPLFIAAPLARQFPAIAGERDGRRGGIGLATLVIAILAPVTIGLAVINDYQPNPHITPAGAVAALKAANAGNVFNDYDLGGYLVYSGIPTFIDGRTELYGSDFTAQHYRAVTLADLPGFLATLDRYRIGATILAPKVPAVAFLDTLPEWKRIYTDDIAVVHVRMVLRTTLQ